MIKKHTTFGSIQALIPQTKDLLKPCTMVV